MEAIFPRVQWVHDKLWCVSKTITVEPPYNMVRYNKILHQYIMGDWQDLKCRIISCTRGRGPGRSKYGNEGQAAWQASLLCLPSTYDNYLYMYIYQAWDFSGFIRNSGFFVAARTTFVIRADPLRKYFALYWGGGGGSAVWMPKDCRLWLEPCPAFTGTPRTIQQSCIRGRGPVEQWWCQKVEPKYVLRNGTGSNCAVHFFGGPFRKVSDF